MEYFAWEGCICMREPYGSLVEFISRYNWDGGFWWDRWEGFWNRQMEPMFDRQSNGTELWWSSIGVEDYWENFLRERNQSQIKNHLVQRK